MKTKKDTINCFLCRHFFVTWDDTFPRGCRAMDFKSRQMPSLAVYDASGIPCRRFEARDIKAPFKGRKGSPA